MTRQIAYLPHFQTDVAEAAEWYEAQRQGLGTGFLWEVDQCLAAIFGSPFRFRRVHKQSRRAPLKGFPYGIIFRLTDEEIVVVACMHRRRHPGTWQGRL